METQELQIAQALELCKKTLADTSQPESDRAIAICWIAHLGADAHQPCHAGSLYMEKIFIDEDGDRGANRIITKQRRIYQATPYKNSLWAPSVAGWLKYQRRVISGFNQGIAMEFMSLPPFSAISIDRKHAEAYR